MSCSSEQWEFYIGEDKLLELSLKTFVRATECKEPFSLATADLVEITLPATPDDLVFDKTTTPAVEVVNEPLGKIKIQLTPTQTDQMTDGSIIVKVTKDGKVTKFVAVSGVKRLTLPGC